MSRAGSVQWVGLPLEVPAVTVTGEIPKSHYLSNTVVIRKFAISCFCDGASAVSKSIKSDKRFDNYDNSKEI